MDNYDHVLTNGVLYEKETQIFTELEISSFVNRK